MIQKKTIGFIALAMMLSFALSATGVFAQTASSTEVLSSIMGTVISTVVELITFVITNYLPYLIVFSLLATLVGIVVHYAHIGTKK